MASAARRRRRTYHGAPWPRSGASSLSTSKMERTKQSKTDGKDTRAFVLPLVVKPDGRWGYKFGRMRPAPNKGHL
jgi:hypothetical protein